jgi:hypothetical protein
MKAKMIKNKNIYALSFLFLLILFTSSLCAEETEEIKIPKDSLVLQGGLEWRICPKDKPIKGNINNLKNTKIYHLPDASAYKRTNPENCFETETEAIQAGFRKSFH